MISANFNRFMHGVVLLGLKQAPPLRFTYPQPFRFRPSMLSLDSLKQLLKHLDENYPKDEEGRPLSYTKLNSKQMHDHLLFIESSCAHVGFELKHIAQEWERISSWRL